VGLILINAYARFINYRNEYNNPWRDRQ